MGEKLSLTTMKQRQYYPDTMFSSRYYLFNRVCMAVLPRKMVFTMIDNLFISLPLPSSEHCFLVTSINSTNTSSGIFTVVSSATPMYIRLDDMELEHYGFKGLSM